MYGKATCTAELQVIGKFAEVNDLNPNLGY